jgi:hypothetical protein
MNSVIYEIPVMPVYDDKRTYGDGYTMEGSSFLSLHLNEQTRLIITKKSKRIFE